ncbi:Lipase-3 domain-containing protein [Aphelenchoides bicaudatus]|nr:Lipase-3 domain-containing protein [Aphelenchoides bicaudatus]
MISFNLRQKLLLSALLFDFLRVEAINCRLITDCYTCAASLDGLLPCHWCSSSQSCANSIDSLQCSEFMRVTYSYDCPFRPPDSYPYLDNYCLAYLAYSPNDNAIVLTFRSTNSDSQFLLEALNFLFYIQKDFNPVGGKVVAYFHDAFYALWNSGLLQEFQQALQQYPNAEVWVFGHSLGGSLASLGAAWIARMQLISPQKLKFVSFGQPRTGKVPYKYRIIHRGDIITKTPLRLPFLHMISFTHHRFEVFYPNEMHMSDTYMICPRAEDPVCSQTCMDPLDAKIHQTYFNISLSEWPKIGCVRQPELYGYISDWSLQNQSPTYKIRPNSGNQLNG